MVEERHGYLIDVDNLDPDDKSKEDLETFRMIQRGETDSLFQIESSGMKAMFSGMNSVDFNDLVAGVALYRPGPIEKIPGYVARRNGVESVPSVHPIYDQITSVTYGYLVYQEQVMEISKQMAGYSMGEADVLRKSIGKKKAEILEPALAELHERMIANGILADVATKVCEDIRPFAGYGFNLSHAAAYALIAYHTAYFKANYPLEYMCAVLQVFYTDEDKVTKYVKVIRDMGIEVLPPDVNRSQIGFSIDNDNAIRFGLGSIKGLGDATVKAILEERTVRQVPVIRDMDGLETIISAEEAETIKKDQMEAEELFKTGEISEEAYAQIQSIVIGATIVGGEFTSVQDLMERVPKRNLNKKALTALCHSGSFDGFMGTDFSNRFEFLAHTMALRGEEPDAELITAIAKYAERMKFEKEKEFLGMFVSGHVLNRHAEPTDWDGLDDATHFTMVQLVEARVITTKKGDKMAFLKVDTLEGAKELTLFPKQYASLKEPYGLVPGMLLKVGLKGKMDWQRNQKTFIVATINIPKKINKDIWKQIQDKQDTGFLVCL